MTTANGNETGVEDDDVGWRWNSKCNQTLVETMKDAIADELGKGVEREWRHKCINNNN